MCERRVRVKHYINIDWFEGNIAQLGALFFNVDQGWRSIFVVLYHRINATNLCRQPWRSNIEYILICLILQSDQKIDANAWCHVVYTMFPGNMDHVVPCFLGTWRCTDKTRQHRLFLHITWSALDQSWSSYSDRDVTILLDLPLWKCGFIDFLQALWPFAFVVYVHSIKNVCYYSLQESTLPYKAIREQYVKIHKEFMDVSSQLDKKTTKHSKVMQVTNGNVSH